MSDKPEYVFVALGSNLGDRSQFLSKGRTGLAGLPETRVLAESSIEETAPIGPQSQGPYLNQILLLETRLSPLELLRCCHEIEQDAGRVRAEKWGPRTLDLDIVRFGTRILESEVLTIPHPEYSNRPFWQRGIAEIGHHAG